jgi:hypothetical protein
MFETSTDTIDFGTYDDYVPWVRIFTVTNNSDQDIEITSSHNHWNSYYVTTPLPLSIPSGETKNVQVSFFPTNQQGQINDVLTLNYESYFADTLAQCVSRQVHLMGFVNDDNPPDVTLNPADGSTEVSQEQILKIMFDEPVVKTDGSTLNSPDISGIIEFRENDISGEVVDYTAYINALKNEIVITPDYLKPLQQYYFELKQGTVADGSGNIQSQGFSSTFTTNDEEKPSATVFPENEAIDVSTLTTITFSFNEVIVLADGSEITDEDIPGLFYLKETDEEGADVGFTGSINDGQDVITLYPDSLKIMQQYFVKLLEGVVSDEFGNVLDEAQESIFTTADDTGIDDKNISQLVTLFPNPHKGSLTLEFEVEGMKDIIVMDAYGKKVYSAENVNTPVYHFDISSEPNGIYLIRVIMKDQNQTVDLKTIKL